MAFYRLDIMGFARFERIIAPAFLAILVVGFLNVRPSRFHQFEFDRSVDFVTGCCVFVGFLLLTLFSFLHAAANFWACE